MITPGKNTDTVWVLHNAEGLVKLGPGRHFGEWWGQGINRGYGLDHRRFSLFDTHKWWSDEVRFHEARGDRRVAFRCARGIQEDVRRRAQRTGSSMTFLKELRDAAMVEQNENLRSQIRAAADGIQCAIDAVDARPTNDTLAHLNSQWTYAMRLIDHAGLFGPPGNSGGAVRLNEQQRMAA